MDKTAAADLGFAAGLSKAARFWYHRDEMAEGFKAQGHPDVTHKAHESGKKWAKRVALGYGAVGAALGVGSAARGANAKTKALRGLGGAAIGAGVGALSGYSGASDHERQKAYHAAAGAAKARNEAKAKKG